MKTISLEGQPKRRCWVLVNHGEDKIAVKILHVAGMHQRAIMARARKEDDPVLYYPFEIVGLIKRERNIKRLQAQYYSKGGRK